MNQKSIVWAVVVVIIVALGVWYFSASKSVDTTIQDMTATTSAATTTGTSATTAAAANANTFHSIFTQSGNHECLYQQVGTSTQTSSIVRIADGKMRGEFRTTGAVSSANLMIYSGGILYSWKEGTTVGKKSSIKSIADLPQAIPDDLTSGAIFGFGKESVGWDCHDWIKDANAFTIPTYVKFTSAS